MARKPILTDYPRLYFVLRQDPAANADFQKCIGKLTGTDAAKSVKDLKSSVEAEQTLRTEAQAEAAKLKVELQKTVRFIRLIGELMESQTELSPYAQDVSEKKSYDIRFDANQIRRALQYYWATVAGDMEAVLTRPEANDPLDKEEED
jgi:chemotaxis protein histidine kinase CheA